MNAPLCSALFCVSFQVKKEQANINCVGPLIQNQLKK